MLVPRATPTEPVVVAGMAVPRVVLIDYHLAVVYDMDEEGKIPPIDWPRPWNPIIYFWHLPMADFWAWVPHGWHDDSKFMQEWLQMGFGAEEKWKLYVPVEREPVILDYDLPQHQ